MGSFLFQHVLFSLCMFMWCVNMKARLTTKRTSMTMRRMIKENFHLTHTKQQINCEAFAFSLFLLYSTSMILLLKTISYNSSVYSYATGSVLCRSLETSNKDKSLRSCSVIKISSSVQSSGKKTVFERKTKENRTSLLIYDALHWSMLKLFNINWKLIYLWAFIITCQC